MSLIAPAGLSFERGGLAVPPVPASTPKRRWLTRVDVAFAVFCLVVAAIRLGMLVPTRAPVGIDGGNWLAIGHDLMGDRIRSPSLVYAPFVPVLVTILVRLLGLVNGFALVTVVTALVPAIGAYLVLRWSGVRWKAAFLAGLLATAASTGEPAAWGGYPQLVGLGLLVVFLWLLDGYLKAGSYRRALGTGAVLALLLATSQFIAFNAILAGAVLVVLHMVRLRRTAQTQSAARLLIGLPLVILPCLPLVPLYVTLVSEISRGLGSRPPFALLRLDNFATSVDFLFRDFEIFWRMALVLACMTPMILLHRWRTTQWLLPTSLLMASGISLAVTAEPRNLYLLPVATVLALGSLSWELQRLPTSFARRSSRGLGVLLALALLVQSVVGLRFFDLQRRYYDVLSPELVAGLGWLRTHTPPGAVVAASRAENDAPIGWWVEGLARRKTLWSSPLRWLNLEDERARARKANQLFATGFPNETALELARGWKVEYVVVVKSWAEYQGGELSLLKARHPEMVAFDNDAVVILRV